MKFVFSKHQKVDSIKQALKLLASEESSEKRAFAKNLVEQEGWIEFKNESYDSYGEIVDGSWWLAHHSVAGLDWQDYGYDPTFQKVDPSLYYDLF